MAQPMPVPYTTGVIGSLRGLSDEFMTDELTTDQLMTMSSRHEAPHDQHHPTRRRQGQRNL